MKTTNETQKYLNGIYRVITFPSLTAEVPDREATEKKMVYRLGDGSTLCDECLKKEYPDKEEPIYGWEAGYCTECQPEQ